MTTQEPGPTPPSASTLDPNPFPNLRFRRRRGLRTATAAAVALGLAVGGGAVANAASSNSTPSTSTSRLGRPAGVQSGVGHSPPAAMGTVASVGTGTFTLTAQDGTTVTVQVSSTTTYLDHGVSSPSLADVKVGAHVAVFGADTANTVTATKVAIDGPDGPDGPGGSRSPGGPGGAGGAGSSGAHGFGGTPPAAMGNVASVGSNTFTVSTRDGATVTVDVTASTAYTEVGVTSATIAGVKVGTRVAVFGAETSDTVTATKVAIGDPMGGPEGPDGPRSPGGPGGPGGPRDGRGFGGSTPVSGSSSSPGPSSGSGSGSSPGPSSGSGSTSGSVTSATGSSVIT